MKKGISIEARTERVPLLIVYKQGDKIKFRTTRDIDNFALLGFLKTYLPVLEKELEQNLFNSNKDKKQDNEFEF